MKTFSQFVMESSIVKKIKTGFKEIPVDIPGAEIIHHDPASKITVYHLKTPKACYNFGKHLRRYMDSGYRTDHPDQLALKFPKVKVQQKKKNR